MVLAFVLAYLAMGVVVGGGLAIAVKRYKGSDWDKEDTATIPFAILFWWVLIIVYLRMRRQ